MHEFFEFLAQHSVTPNGLLVLHMLCDKVGFTNYVNVHTEQTRLTLSGHLQAEPLPEGGKQYVLTPKGLHLLRDAETQMSKTRKRKKLASVPFADWELQIKQYLSCFPVGSQGSQPIRSTPKSLHDRFQWFFLEYPEYSWATVLQATQAYNASIANSADGGKYQSTSKYFIKKEERDRTCSSRLADWCNAVLEGSLEEIAAQGHTYFGTDIV